MQRAAPSIACGSREYSGRVLLSDVPSPPREVRTPAADGRPARWTRLPAPNRLRSRSSPPDEDRRRSPPRNRRRPARRHCPARRLLPVPAARPRPLVLGYSPALHRLLLGKNEAGRRAAPARPRAESEPMERSAAPQLATATRRSWPPRLCAASSPRRARSQSAATPPFFDRPLWQLAHVVAEDLKRSWFAVGHAVA